MVVCLFCCKNLHHFFNFLYQFCFFYHYFKLIFFSSFSIGLLRIKLHYFSWRGHPDLMIRVTSIRFKLKLTPVFFCVLFSWNFILQYEVDLELGFIVFIGLLFMRWSWSHYLDERFDRLVLIVLSLFLCLFNFIPQHWLCLWWSHYLGYRFNGLTQDFFNLFFVEFFLNFILWHLVYLKLCFIFFSTSFLWG